MPAVQFENETELVAYINLCGEAAELLAQLTEWVENHGDVSPDAVSYVDVNRMRTVVARLQATTRLTEGV